MPRNRRLYRTSTKKTKGTTKAKEAPPPSAAPLPPTTQPSSPPPTSFGAALAHGVASGVGWGVGTNAVKAALGLGGDAGSGGVGDSSSTTPNASADTGATLPTLPTLPADACGTLWVAYQRCLDESGGRACDHVKEGLDAVCPGFQAPLDGVVREATTPTYALSLPPL